MDEEKGRKGEVPNLSSSHDRRVALIAGGCLSVPTPLQRVPWWMGTFNIALLKGITGMYLSFSKH